MELDTESLWRQLTETFQELMRVEDWGDYLKRRGALEKGVTTAQFQAVEQAYFAEIEARIAQCEAWLPRYRCPAMHVVLARLYDHADVRNSAARFYKRPTRFHLLKALRLHPQYSAAWALLGEVYAWIAFIGGETEEIPDVRLDPGYGYQPELEMIERTSAKPQSYVTESYALTAQQQRQIRTLDRAIRCMTKATQLDPNNEAYQDALRYYHHQRNQEYQPESVPRIMTYPNEGGGAVS